MLFLTFIFSLSQKDEPIIEPTAIKTINMMKKEMKTPKITANNSLKNVINNVFKYVV